jgi:hypothetical protein
MMFLHVTGLVLALLSFWVAVRILGAVGRLLGWLFNIVFHVTMYRGRLWPPD